MNSSIDVPLPLNVSTPLWVQALPARVAAGFPSPAEDHQVQRLDLMAQLIRHPQATFLLRVKGDSMIDAAICEGDYVVVRSQPTAKNGDIVAALINGEEATVKTYKQRDGHVWLMPHNPEYAPILGDDAKILGIVKTVLRKI